MFQRPRNLPERFREDEETHLKIFAGKHPFIFLRCQPARILLRSSLSLTISRVFCCFFFCFADIIASSSSTGFTFYMIGLHDHRVSYESDIYLLSISIAWFCDVAPENTLTYAADTLETMAFLFQFFSLLAHTFLKIAPHQIGSYVWAVI